MPRTILAPLLLIAGLGSIAGCSTGVAVPRTVALDTDRLSVRMSDNSLCRGRAPAGDAGAGWSGRLEDCAWRYAYNVEIDPRANPLRMILEEVLGAFGAGDILMPRATVTITDAEGRVYTFAAPPDPG